MTFCLMTKVLSQNHTNTHRERFLRITHHVANHVRNAATITHIAKPPLPAFKVSHDGLNSRAWCLLIPESQLSAFPALELPSKRSTFTAHSFLQKAVNELLHPTRTYEEISLICQNIATLLTKNGFHSEFLFSM